MPPYHLRRFRAHDQQAVRALILDGLGEYFAVLDPSLNQDLNDLERNYCGESRIFLVAEKAGKVIGAGALVPAGNQAGRVVRISVARAQRRQGIGRAILVELAGFGRRFGFRELVVETNHDWHTAIALYKAFGFEVCGQDEESFHLNYPL